MKMYYRNRTAIVWSLVFPLIIMLTFGLFNFEKYNAPKLGINDLSQNKISDLMIESLVKYQENNILKINFGNEKQLSKQLKDGKIDAYLNIPKKFGNIDEKSKVKVFFDDNNPEERSAIEIILQKSITEIFNETSNIPNNYKIESRFEINKVNIVTESQGFKGFLVPGIAAMAIMQTGLFSVVFTLIKFKVEGVLRRLNATPIGSSHFIIGQLITRIIVVIIQTYILILVGILVLGVSIGQGNPLVWVEIAIVSFLGGSIFLSFGLAISGWAKYENTATPITNLIALPMMFLSVVFFPLSVMPDWVISFAKYLPLTFLADSLRSIALYGLSITDIIYEIIGLLVWLLISLILAIKTFKWE